MIDIPLNQTTFVLININKYVEELTHLNLLLLKNYNDHSEHDCIFSNTNFLMQIRFEFAIFSICCFNAIVLLKSLCDFCSVTAT